MAVTLYKNEHRVLVTIRPREIIDELLGDTKTLGEFLTDYAHNQFMELKPDYYMAWENGHPNVCTLGSKTYEHDFYWRIEFNWTPDSP